MKNCLGKHKRKNQPKVQARVPAQIPEQKKEQQARVIKTPKILKPAIPART